MAEILVLARGEVSSDWEDDDPVAIMPDGWEWGREERNPAKFRIVSVPGVSERSLDYLLESNPQGKARKFRISQDGRFVDKDTGLESQRSR